MSQVFTMPLFGLVMLVLAVTVSGGFFGYGFRDPNWNQCLTRKLPCSFCGHRIDVTLISRNQIEDPKFENRITLEGKRRRFLLEFLEDAADANGAFNFSASYHGNLGFMVNTINGVTANVKEKTYWQIISETSGKALECGVSTYLPKNSETILFNFTTWG